jgi:hypothetical protein
VEGDGSGVPVLIRQYLRVGGRILGFNLDPNFKTLDALILVDLRLTPPALLARYMSGDGAAEFLRRTANGPSCHQFNEPGIRTQPGT